MPMTLKEAKENLQELTNYLRDRLGSIKDMQTLQFFLSLADKYSELETVLEAWHSVFGTTQLTHAQARLEQAEKEAKKSLPCQHLAFKTLTGKITELFIDNEEWVKKDSIEKND